MENHKNFAWPVTVMAKEDYDALKKAFLLYQQSGESKQIIIFGAGIRGSIFRSILKKWRVKSLVFVDNNEAKWDGFIEDTPIKSPKYLESQLEESVVFISIENGEAIKTQLEAMGYRENTNYFFVKSTLYEDFTQEFNRETTRELLFFGDCGLSQIAMQDEVTANLAELLRRRFGKEGTKVLAMHGMGMRAFYELLRLQIQKDGGPKMVGLMINFEVFTGKHHILPRTQHVGLFEQLAYHVQEDEALQTYIELIKERFNALKLDVFSNQQQGRDTVQNSRLIMKQNYMYRLKEASEDMVYMKKILAVCQEKGISVIPFIPPVNYQFAEKLHEEAFYEKYNANREKMIQLIANEGYETLDLSYLLTSDYFADVTTVDESANYKGREKIAEAIGEATRQRRERRG